MSRSLRNAVLATVFLVGVPLLTTAAAAHASPSPAAPKARHGGGSATSAGGTPTAKDRATFGIGPSTASGPGGAFSYQTGPGGSYADKAVITNYSRFPLTLGVYVATLGNAADGGIQVGKQNQLTDAGTWLSLPQGLTRVTVPAATARRTGKATVPFQLSVPNAAEPGDHAAAIVASLTTLGTNPKGENVRLEQRIAARIYIRVAGPLRPGLAVQGVTAEYTGTANPVGHGSTTVRYTVQNTGNTRLSAAQSITVSGWFGTSARVTAPNIPLLFPGASVTYSVTVPGVFPTVAERAKVSLSPRVLTGGTSAPMKTVAAQASFWALPWLLLGVLLAVVLVIGFLFDRRRRARRRRINGPRPRDVVAKHANSRGKNANKHRSVRAVSRVIRPAAAVAVALACFTASVVTGVAAQADPAVPFTDPSAKGSIGFCNATGDQVSSGKLSDIPFVLRAVSTAPVPDGYTVGAGAKASLFAYLPMKGVDPGDWTGQALTGAAFFSNPDHPMTEATVLDPSLGSFARHVSVYWNDLIQLRMFVGEAGKPTYVDTYPTAVVQVTGSTWHLVQGGHVDCSAGRTKALETLGLPKSRFASASASIAAASSSAASAASSASPASSAASRGQASGAGVAAPTRAPSHGAGGSGTADHAAGPAAGAAPAASNGAAAEGAGPAAGDASSSGSGGSSVPLVLRIVVLALAGSAVSAWLVRRRRTAG